VTQHFALYSSFEVVTTEENVSMKQQEVLGRSHKAHIPIAGTSNSTNLTLLMAYLHIINLQSKKTWSSGL
jgi:hypothetical protein